MWGRSFLCSAGGSREEYCELQSRLWMRNVDEGCQESWILPLRFTMKVAVCLDLVSVDFLFVFSVTLMKQQNTQCKLTHR